jgi:hypothetical protein
MRIMSVEITGVGASTNTVTTKAAGASGASDFSAVMQKTAQSGAVNLDKIFEAASEKYNVPVKLLKAVAKAESNFNPKATSPCGAMGVMQLMPATATSLGVTDAYDPVQNIMGGAKFLSQLLKYFDGNTTLAVAGYNAGPGAVTKYNGIPPYKETQNYVQKVMGYLSEDITAGSVASGAPVAGAPIAGVLPGVDASAQQNLGVLIENALMSGAFDNDLPGLLGSLGAGASDGADSIMTTIYQLQLQMMMDRDKDDNNVIV